FVFGHEAQWLEAAGALAIVFEQDALVFERVEKLFGDAIVGAFTVPLRDEFPGFGIDRPSVAAADMDAEGHLREAFNERVVSLDRTLEIPLRIFASAAHSLQ